MVVGKDTVTFRFRLDAKEMQRLIKALEADARRFGGTMEKVKGQTDRLGPSIGRLGNNAAASAVNFQTATQGMLNLSTAAVQTYTSISNLDRANNRAKMSIIAVARAEDLLNNKRQRLQDMTDAGITSGGKYANMQREIATATADLTVKQEKQKIEQAAVNDIYMLFATNIANVSISSLQTMGVLLGQEKMARLASIATTKLHTFATWDNVRAHSMNQKIMAMNSPVLQLTKAGHMGATMATRLHTAALTGLKIALGPIGLIFIGISAAMLAYESNLGGVKDTINELLGVKDPFEESLAKERELTQGLTQDNNALAGSFKKLMPVHEQYIKMMRDAAVNRGDSRLAASYQAQLQQPARQGNFSSGVGSPSFSGSGGTSYGGVSSGTSITQGSIIQQQAQINDINLRRESRGMSPVSYSAPTLTESPDPMGSIMQQEIFKLLTPPEQMETLMQLSISEGLKGRKGSSEEYMRKAESMRYEAESWRPRGIETDPVKAFKAVQNTNTSMKATDRGSTAYYPTGMSKSIHYGGQGDGSGLAFYLQGRDTKFNINASRQMFYAGLGGKKIANHFASGGSFGMNKGDIRGTGGNAFLDELGRIQAEGLDFTKTNTNLGKHTLAQFNTMNRESNVSDMSRFRGQVSPSETLEILRRNAKTLADKKIRLAEQDRIANLKRFGGYSSRKAQSEASKAAFYSSVDQAARMMRFFGDQIQGSRIYGRSSRRSEYNRILQAGTQISQALQNAGLSYSTNFGSLPYRHSADQYARYALQKSEVIAFNHNQLAKARQINLLQMQYGLTGFTGSTMSLSALEDRVGLEDERMSALGLSRTQAVDIVAAQGRGRQEIEDRLRFSDQLEAMSSGTSPL